MSTTLIHASPEVESLALNGTRFLPDDGIFTEHRRSHPRPDSRIVYDQAGFGVFASNRPDGDGKLTVSLWAALPASDASDDDEDGATRQIGEHCARRFFAYRFDEKHLESVLAELVAVAQQLTRLRAGGWYIEEPRYRSEGETAAYGDHLRVFNPLDPATRTFVLLDPGSYKLLGDRQLSVRKIVRQLRDAIAKLADIADMPLRYDDSAVQGRLDAFMATIPEGPGLAQLALARWPELEGPFLAALIERAADLEQEGLSAVQAVERAGSMPLAGPRRAIGNCQVAAVRAPTV